MSSATATTVTTVTTVMGPRRTHQQCPREWTIVG